MEAHKPLEYLGIKKSGITRHRTGERKVDMKDFAKVDVTETDTAGEIVFSLLRLRKQRNLEAL